MFETDIVKTDFYQSLSKDYLQELQLHRARHKWKQNIQIEELMLIAVDNLPPQDYNLFAQYSLTLSQIQLKEEFPGLFHYLKMARLQINDKATLFNIEPYGIINMQHQF